MILDEESLSNLFAEVEAIVNSRPMVVETINDVNSEVALSPSHILTMKSKVVMPPPGVFGKPDLYCRRRWRRIQHISNEFWSRWRKEFLGLIQLSIWLSTWLQVHVQLAPLKIIYDYLDQMYSLWLPCWGSDLFV